LQSRLQGENDEQVTIGSAGSSRQFRWLGLRVRFNTKVSPGKMPGLCFYSAGIHCVELGAKDEVGGILRLN